MELTGNAEFSRDVSIYIAKLCHNDKLMVARTTLPSCTFLGLYASERFNRGQIVCLYVGDRYRTAAAIKLSDKSYLMRLGEQSYVDALPHKDVFARFINDCINPKGWNAEFVKLPDKGYAQVVATREIRPGEEIFVSYGKRYWMLQKPIKVADEHLQAMAKGHGTVK